MSPVIKTHRCGQSGAQRATTASEWPRLEYVGRMPLTDETDCELRNCGDCRSTIAIEVPAGA